jgi:hypothetical protein
MKQEAEPEKTIDQTQYPNKIHLPFRVTPKGKHSDSRDDFHIRFSEWVNHICEILSFSYLGNAMTIPGLSLVPKIKKDNFDPKNPDYVPVPQIILKDKNMDGISNNISRSLFYNSISQLVAMYEFFLTELAEEILWRHRELLGTDEKQLTSREIFELGDIKKIHFALIQRKVFSLGMSGYPKRVKTFQSLFHIGLHSTDSPLRIEELHDLIEIRNLIQHSDGFASDEYFQRMSIYNGYKTLLTKQYGVLKTDFLWLLTFGGELVAQVEYIDNAIAEKWKTSRND